MFDVNYNDDDGRGRGDEEEDDAASVRGNGGGWVRSTRPRYRQYPSYTLGKRVK